MNNDKKKCKNYTTDNLKMIGQIFEFKVPIYVQVLPRV